MKVPLEWLGEWVDWRGTTGELAEKLTQSGTEVVAIHATGCQVQGIVSAKIIEKKPHPNADRLTICQVDDGSGPRQVVCGAKNHNVGDVVPLAKPGTVFQSGIQIKSAKLRGESSDGMLCSAQELGLAEEGEGLLLLPPATALGVPLEKLFPGETVMEVEITSNRPDLASIAGLARELSALGVAQHSRPPATVVAKGELPDWKVLVEAGKICPHYTLSGLRVRGGVETPEWIKKRLTAAGMRSLGLLVDVTNYVLWETGQPVHVFDASRLQGSSLCVRLAKPGEVMLGLDGAKHVLQEEDLVIVDEGGVVALAGVVGGKESAVEPTTVNVLLEVATFAAGPIRRTARRLALRTESATRFARGGIDPALVETARNRVIQLLQEAGALEKYTGTCSVGGVPQLSPVAVPLRWEKAEEKLGFTLDQGVFGQRLGCLGFREERGRWVAPSWRGDVREEIDLVEELVRLSDLAKIPARFDSLAEGESVDDRAEKGRRQIRSFLIERGFFEILSGALVRTEEAGSARLRLAASPEATGYRQSLLAGLGRAAGRNISRGTLDLRLFELGRVSVEGGKEEMRLGLLVAGRERPVHWQEGEVRADQFSLKGLWQELAQRCPSLGLPLVLREMSATEKKSVGIKIPVWFSEGKVEVRAAAAVAYTPVSSYPGVQRDLALVLPDHVTLAEVEKVIRMVAPVEMESFRVFDRFVDATGQRVASGFLSLGCRLHFRSSARTLTEVEVGSWEKEILQALSSQCEAKLRAVL